MIVSGINDQANPRINAKGVSNRKENQKDVPVLSHKPGVK